MADEAKLTNIHRNLFQARTVGYIISFLSIFVATTLHIERVESRRSETEIERKREELASVADAAAHALLSVRLYLSNNGLAENTDSKNVKILLKAKKDAQQYATKVTKQLTTQGLDVLELELVMTRFLTEPEADPQSAEHPEAIIPVERLEQLRLRDLEQLTRYVEMDPISGAQLLEEAWKHIKDGGASGVVVQTLREIVNKEVLGSGKLSAEILKGRIIKGWDYSSGGINSSFTALHNTLNRMEGRQVQVREARSDARTTIPIISQQVSSKVVMATFPLLVLAGALLVAVPLTHARRGAEGADQSQRHALVDIGVVFTELRKANALARCFAWPLLALILFGPVLSAAWVIWLGRGDSAVDAALILFWVLSVLVALVIGGHAWALSGIAK